MKKYKIRVHDNRKKMHLCFEGLRCIKFNENGEAIAELHDNDIEYLKRQGCQIEQVNSDD